MEKKSLNPEELAYKAIEFLEIAGKFEDEDNISKALENYEKALKYLLESEYLPHRVDDIRDHITKLKKQSDAEDLSKREIKKTEKEKLQNEAFLLLEQGKKLELDGNFKKALNKYDSAISMLKDIGWSESQLENVKDKRRELLDNYDKKKKIKKQKIVQYTTQKADRSNLKVSLENIPELKDVDYLESEFNEAQKLFQAQKEENEIKNKAFKLIDEGKELERQEKYEQAINKFREVLDLFQIINWSSYTESIKTLIDQMEQKQQAKIEERKRREKREKELEDLKQSLKEKREQDLEEIGQAKLDKQKQIQEIKAIETKRENKLISLLEQADQFIKNNAHTDAIKNYEQALQLLKDMGLGWQHYVEIIYETIENVKKTHDNLYEIQYQEQKKKERQIKQKEEFQDYISQKLKVERKKLEEKEIELKQKEEEVKHREKLKEKAFQFMDEAQNKVMELNFDGAIEDYQKARKLFSEIQWTDELRLIENSIRELQKKKDELLDQKNKQMEQRIKKLKEEEEFQSRIQQKLELERKKLKEKEVSLREKEDELEYQRKQKEKALKILDNAGGLIENRNYDDAIELYHDAARIFSNIQWKDEAKMIIESVNELEKKKKDDLIQEQKEFEKALEREKAKSAFQVEISKRMKAERRKLEEKKIKLRKKEEELEFRKQKRDEAFKKLDKAKYLLSRGKFEETLEIYYQVRNIFAQIQWLEELPVINEAIEEIKEKKREKELWEQKAVNQAVKEELEHAAFMETLKNKRKIEKRKELEKREKLEIQKQIETKNKEKERKAFDLIDNADILLEEEKFDKALSHYSDALEILNSIGWKGEYLRLIKETMKTIKEEKKAYNLRDLEEKEKLQHLELKNLDFQRRLSESMEKERSRLKEKELKIEENKKLQEKKEELKQKAFTIIDEAEELLNKGNYEDSIEKYREAELILNKIQYPTDLIRETIAKVKEQKRKDEIGKQNELELRLKREQEEKQLEKQITERMKEEQEKMKAKKIELARQQQLEEEIEKNKRIAFDLLDQAQDLIKNNEFEEAIQIYHKVSNIFDNINWNEESDRIREAIDEIEQKKRDMEIKKVRELNELIEQGKKEEKFREQLRKEAQLKKQQIAEQRLKREEQKELEEQVGERKKEAFSLLDLADEYLSEGNYDEAINVYYEVANIFAEIQWKEEIPRIYDAIKEIRSKRKEELQLKQENLKTRIKKEEEDEKFLDKIQKIRINQREKELKEAELRKKQEELSTQKEEKQAEAFKIIENADKLIENERYNEAIESYENAINIFVEIGWEGPYLKVIKETLEEIKARKKRQEISLQKEEEKRKRAELEAKKFQQKISESMQREQKRLREKQIQIAKIKEIKEKENELKEKAFDLIDKAESLTENEEYENSLDLYHESELILNQIGFPTTSIQEKIQKLQEKKRQKEFEKQRNLISKLREEKKNEELQRQIAQRMEIEKRKLEEKKKKLKKREEIQSYFEKNKDKAFNLLDKAELLTREAKYEEALKTYQDAELILSGLNFPTDSINNVILQIKEKNKAKQLEKHKELEQKLQKEQRENYFRRYMARRMEDEKQRLLNRRIRVEEFQKRQQLVEEKKQEAFNLMDDAESLIKQENYDQAVDIYRKAQLILNQISYPTESIENTINSIMEMQEEKQKERMTKYQTQLEQIEQEKALQNLIKRRKTQEAERKRAKAIALKEREELIKKQKSYREAAYSLLDKASEFLRKREPEYDKAISLYIEARDLLAERIGWDPELKNMEKLIQDLQEEKTKLEEKKKKEKESELRREREYQKFIEEMRLAQREQLRLKKQKELELRKLKQRESKLEELRDAGLEYIEQGKKFASYERFDKAYEMFDQAIETFRFLGWKHQLGYIEKQIAEVERMEKEAKEKRIELKKSKKQRERQKKAEELVELKKERELKETVGEVSIISKEVSNTLEKQKIEESRRKEKEKEQLIQKSKEFRKDMGLMIKLKEEIKRQIEEENERKRKEEEARIKEEKRKEVEDIKKMLKETSKNNDKKI